MVEYIKHLLTTQERSPAWLSRKIGVSHTLVYGWLNGKRKLNPYHFEIAMAVFGVPLDIARDRLEEQKRK